MGKYVLAALISGMFLAPAGAQEGWRFRWQAEQVLSYRVEHHTTVSETVGDSKTETTSKLTLVKRWQVQEVDAQGTATLQMSLAALRHEQSRPNGEVLLFDSANLDKSTPELREAMAKFVNQPLAVLRVDVHGRVVEVKQGQASRYESELPFVLVLPAEAPQPGQAWQRPFKLALESLQGSSEQHEASQRYVCTKADANSAIIQTMTELKAQPEDKAEQAALFQKLPQGEVVFDIRSGRLVSAHLRIDREMQGHQGEGSSYRFQSQYTEQLVTGK